jgi:hypothetical protein
MNQKLNLEQLRDMLAYLIRLVNGTWVRRFFERALIQVRTRINY